MLLRHYLDEGLTVTEISRELGISRQTIYRWLSGAPSAQSTAGNLLKLYRIARYVFPACEGHRLPQSQNSREIASNCGNFPTRPATVQAIGQSHIRCASGEDKILP